MSVVTDERRVLEDGLKFVKTVRVAKRGTHMREMVTAIEKRYFATKRGQGKSRNKSAKGNADSQFFCVLVQLLAQAVSRSRNSSQLEGSISQIYSWYRRNLFTYQLAGAEVGDESHENSMERLLAARQAAPSPVNENPLLSDILRKQQSSQHGSGGLSSTLGLVGDVVKDLDVSRVKGHPSDIYPESFTQEIVESVMQEAEEASQSMKPNQLQTPEVRYHRGSGMGKKDIADFFKLTEELCPPTPSGLRGSCLRPRSGPRKIRKSHTAGSRADRESFNLQHGSCSSNTLKVSDIMNVADFASAEISYEKEASPLLLQSKILNMTKWTKPATADCSGSGRNGNPVWSQSALPARPATASAGFVDWRGQVTPQPPEDSLDHLPEMSSVRPLTALSNGMSTIASSVIRPLHRAPRSARPAMRSPRLDASPQFDSGSPPCLKPGPSRPVSRSPQPTSRDKQGQGNPRPASKCERPSSKADSRPSSRGQPRGQISLPLTKGMSGIQRPTTPATVLEYGLENTAEKEIPAAPASSSTRVAQAASHTTLEIDKESTKDMLRLHPLQEKKKKPVRSFDPDSFFSDLGLEDYAFPASARRVTFSDMKDYATFSASQGREEEPEYLNFVASVGSSDLRPSSAPNGSSSLVMSSNDVDGFLHDKNDTAVNAATPSLPSVRASSARSAKSPLTLTSKYIEDQHIQSPLADALGGDLSLGGHMGAVGGDGDYAGSGPEDELTTFRGRTTPEYKESGTSMKDPTMRVLTISPTRELSPRLNPTAETTPRSAGRPKSEMEDPSGMSMNFLMVNQKPVQSKADTLLSARSGSDRLPSASPRVRLTVSDTAVGGGGNSNDAYASQKMPTRTCLTASGGFSRPIGGYSYRPIPQVGTVEDRLKTTIDTQRLKEARAGVDIQKIFRGQAPPPGFYKNLDRRTRDTREDQRALALQLKRVHQDHVQRTYDIYSRQSTNDMKEWATSHQKLQQERDHKRNVLSKSRAVSASTNKRQARDQLKRIGPHVTTYDAFHPAKPDISIRRIHEAASTIQKLTRGMLLRNKLAGIMIKAKAQFPTWPKFVSYYKNFLKMIQLRNGIEKPSVQFDLDHVERFLSQKKRYETMFDRRSFGGELPEDELVAFLNECELSPAQFEIEDTLDLLFPGSRRVGGAFTKKEILDIIFEIYPPGGMALKTYRQSSWLHPIVDGKDQIQIRGETIEPAPLAPCIALVAASMRERKLAQLTREAAEL